MTETSVRNQQNLKKPDWDLSWYECLIRFEDKQREKNNKLLLQAENDRKNEKNREKIPIFIEDDKKIEEDNTNVVMPALVLKQMEVVKQQMTEYNEMMEMLELTMGKNDKLQMEIETIRNENKGLQKQIDLKVAKKEIEIQKMNHKFSSAQVQKEKLKKKLLLSRKKEDMLKRKSDKTLEELKLLRDLNRVIESGGDAPSVASSDLSIISDSIVPPSRASADDLKSSSPSSSEASDQLWQSVSKLVQPSRSSRSLSADGNDKDDDDNGSTDSSKTRLEKKNLIKLLIKSLRDEESDVASPMETDDSASMDDMSSVSSSSRSSKYYSSNRSNKFFSRFLTALQEEEEEDQGKTRNRPRPRSSV